MGLALVLPASASAKVKAAAADPYKVLVVTSTTDPVTTAGVAAITSAGSGGVYTVNAPAPAAVGAEFTPANLDTYRAVVFLNTGLASPLNDAQRANFEAYYKKGGGFVGIGSAVETDASWAFLTSILGTRSASRTAEQSGTVKVFDRVHEASKTLPMVWERTDNWYNFTTDVKGVSHVLATVVEDPFGPQPQGNSYDGIAGGTMGANHPVSWCKDFQGGRSFYTALGNTAAAYDATLTTHLKGAVNWAAGQADPIYSDCGATVLKNYQQTKVSGPPNLNEPIGFDQFPDGRIIQTSRRGDVRLHNPTTGTTTQIANFADPSVPLTQRIYTNSEDGMYGPAVDNNFATNKWVYLYYSPLLVTDIKYSDGTTGHTNDFSIAPYTTGAAPTTGASPSVWDPWLGYFQLSRFKFIDDAPGSPAHLDLASEQQILRVSNNRGACCHVAGDIDFDKNNNLWFTTGDDSAAGSGDAGNWGQSIDQKTDETQTVRVNNATAGTFTLSLGGQTTAPIAYNATAATIQTALEGLSTIGAGNVQVTGTGTVATTNQTVLFKGTNEEKDVATLVSNATALTGTAPTAVVAVTREGGWYRMPAADSARSALNTNDLRGKVNRIKVKDTITAADFNKAAFTGADAGAYTIPAGNLFPLTAGAPQAKTRPEVYAMGFRNPFRIQVDENDVAYVTDYSPDSQTPQQYHGTQGVGRVEIVRKPSNYGWPYCFSADLPEYPWNVNLQVPMDALTHQPVPAGQTPQPYSCAGATVPNNDMWNTNGGPGNEPGLTSTPSLTAPDVWYSYRDNNTTTPLGTPCFTAYGPNALTAPNAPGSASACPRLFPELFTGGVGPHGATKYHYNAANPSTKKFPPYYDNSVVMGEFTQDTMREIKLDSQNRVFKINGFLDCGAFGGTTFAFECDNPEDLQFGADGSFYLLTYGDGFFNINADAGLYRWDYVKGQRSPKAVLTADKTNGPTPLTVNFSSAGSLDEDPADSIRYEWDFGDGTPMSLEANPTHTYTKAGRYTAVLSVIDSTDKKTSTSTVITVGNTAPTVVVTAPLDGGLFSFGDTIQFKVTVTDPDDPSINCNDVNVTFVLGHDTHGHAEAGTTGCTGFLPTDAGDVAHGGNVFGVISASYTDKGGQGANAAAPSLSTTSQVQIRQKRQEVEFVVNQSGTNTAANTDVPGTGVHRGSLAAADYLQLNGPFNLFQADSITFRVADVQPATGVNPRVVGSPLAAIEIRQDSITGPILTTANLTSTGSTTAAMIWNSQTFPLPQPSNGKHELFLVFRAVTGGSTGGNLFNLNWAEFNGNGVTVQSTSTTGPVGGTVAATLSLTLGTPASFGPFTPGVARDYLSSTTANVISTAGDATLSVADPATTNTGKLVNGTFALPQTLQANGTRPGAPAGAYAPVGGSANPTTVATYSGPVSNEVATIGFKQPIAANDALRTGAYSKTLTFTLSTTTP